MFHKDLKGQNLHIARSNYGNGSPVGVITPAIIAEFYWDVIGSELWMSTGTGINDWVVASSGITTYNNEVITIVNAQLTYTLSATPVIAQSTQIYLSGLRLKYSIDFTVSGDQITLIPSALDYLPDNTMEMEILYI